MEKLDAVKRVLRAVGSPPVAQLDSGDRAAGRADEILDNIKDDNLLVGYHFNTDIITLSVNVDGRVPLPEGLLEIKFEDPRISYRLLEKDGKLYLWDIPKNDFLDTAVIDYRAVNKVPDWTTLPHTFATWCIWGAAGEFFLQRNGEKIPVPDWILIKERDARSDFLNNLAEANLNIATGHFAHENIGTGATVNAGGEPIRF